MGRREAERQAVLLPPSQGPARMRLPSAHRRQRLPGLRR